MLYYNNSEIINYLLDNNQILQQLIDNFFVKFKDSIQFLDEFF
jgi:hypothetical protein